MRRSTRHWTRSRCAAALCLVLLAPVPAARAQGAAGSDPWSGLQHLTRPAASVQGGSLSTETDPASTDLPAAASVTPAVPSSGAASTAVSHEMGTPRAGAPHLVNRIESVVCRVVRDGENVLSRLGRILGPKGERGQPSSADPLSPDAQLVTDKGRKIPAVPTPFGVPITEQEAVQYLKERGLAGRAQEVAGSSQVYDCHGFVFTGGQRWIANDQVEEILADNGYAVEPQPRVGDVAIYRDARGAITHSALVTSIDAAGTVTLTSKWGDFPLYRHGPRDVPPEYGIPTYYHTDRRGGNLLHVAD